MKLATTSRLTVLFLVYSAVALIVTLVVHAALYFGFNLRTAAPNVWTAIQLSIVLTAVGVVFCYRHPPTFTPEMMKDTSPVMSGLLIMLGVFFVYAIVNVFYWERRLHFGHLDFVQGHYVIMNKGTIVKSVLPPELPTYQLYQARKYSGHWMVCNAVLCTIAFGNAVWSKQYGKEGSIEGRE